MRCIVVLFFILTRCLYAQSTIPYKLQDIGVTEKLGITITVNHQFKDPVLDKIVYFDDFFKDDKPVLLSFVYYSCPMLCNFITTSMVDTLNELPRSILDDFNIVSISINPNDTMPQAIAFRDRYRSKLQDPEKIKWSFLLGQDDSVKQLADSVGFKYKLTDDGEYSHSAVLLFLSPSKQVTRYLYGLSYEPFDFKLSIIEAKKNQQVSTIEKLLLFCYNYDPQSRKYSIYAFRLLRLGGGLTVIGILFMMWKLNRSTRS